MLRPLLSHAEAALPSPAAILFKSNGGGGIPSDSDMSDLLVLSADGRLPCSLTLTLTYFITSITPVPDFSSTLLPAATAYAGHGQTENFCRCGFWTSS